MKKTLIERIDVGAGGAASITFSSIPQTYDGLYVLFSGRSTDTSISDQYDPLLYRLNDSTTGYSARTLVGTGSVTGSNAPTTDTASVGGTWGRLTFNGIGNSLTTSNTFSSVSFYLPNYTASANKSGSMDMVYENNATRAGQEIDASLWSNTAAVTQVAFALKAGSFASGSSVTLYGITAGSDGTTTVS